VPYGPVGLLGATWGDWCLAAGDAMKSSMPVLPPKKAVALELLERTSVFVHLDPRRPSVLVPPEFTKQPQLVLQIGLNMAIQIPDLDVNDEGISCTLSFNRRPHFCLLPWSAIYALIGEQGGGMVWPEDVPPEVVSQRQPGAAKKDTRPSRPNLRAIEQGDPADRKVRPAAEAAKPKRPEAPVPQAQPARRDAGIRRTTPPRLVQVVSNAPEAESAQASAEAQAEEARPNEQASAREAAPGKRTRPPYLRLVD
jgi:stringent starvation protein B